MIFFTYWFFTCYILWAKESCYWTATSGTSRAWKSLGFELTRLPMSKGQAPWAFSPLASSVLNLSLPSFLFLSYPSHPGPLSAVLDRVLSAPGINHHLCCFICSYICLMLESLLLKRCSMRERERDSFISGNYLGIINQLLGSGCFPCKWCISVKEWKARCWKLTKDKVIHNSLPEQSRSGLLHHLTCS